MKVEYDREEDILTVELDPSSPIDHAEKMGTVIVHVGPKNQPVLLEILHASDFVGEIVKESMRSAA